MMKNQTSVISRTFHYYWQATKIQPWIFFLSLLSTLAFVFFLTFANPMIIGAIIDKLSASHIEASEVLPEFGSYILLLLLVNILGQTASKLQDYTVWKLKIRGSYELATLSFNTLSNQSMTFHSNQFGGSLVSQTQKLLNGYMTLVECFVYAVLPIVCSAIFTIAILSSLVPSYVLILVVLLIVYLFSAYAMYKRILPLNSAASTASNALSGELSDSITNILSVKTYGREEFERELFNKANREVLAADTARMRASNWRGATTSFIIVIIMLLVSIFVTGGNAWFGISAGTLVMMFTYTYSLTMQFNRINSMFQTINRGFGDAHDMVQVLDEPQMVADVDGARDIQITRGNIEFEHLSFGYEDADANTLVFDNLCLTIKAGERVGLVGRSGSGKSTLTKILLRLSDVQKGQILIDGQDISKVTQVSLRSQIAYVPQEPMLFHRSIRDNIAYGKPSATEEEIVEAARRASALEFIETLPRGFDTVTGERGVKLSGGQRQRIAIARTILADTPVLVLDEATSALDSESEKLIQDALANLMRERTSIVIAHRLSTVATLDRIIVLSDGKVIEDGGHEELLAAGGEYAQLWARQTGQFFNFN